MVIQPLSTRLIKPNFFFVLLESIAGPHQLMAAKTQPAQPNKETATIDHRRCQNVVRTSVTQAPNGSCVTFLFLPHFDIICDLLLII